MFVLNLPFYKCENAVSFLSLDAYERRYQQFRKYQQYTNVNKCFHNQKKRCILFYLR